MNEVTLNITPSMVNSEDVRRPHQETISFNTKEIAKHSEPIKTQIFDLVPEDHPVLREALLEFDFDNPPVDPNAFASSLVETCIRHRGMGLSANQCGFKHRVFVMGAGDDYCAFFNPKVIAASTEQVHMVEGCLSFPLLGLNITRPAGIVLEYQNYLGEIKTQNFVGISARCILHELDHMNGIVYTDRCKPLALQQGLKKRKKLSKKIRIK